MNKFFKGEELYGDDFDLSEIRDWYLDEKEASEELRKTYNSYNKFSKSSNFMNIFYGFRFLEDNLKSVLSIGGAYGKELFPILDKIKGDIFIIESSQEILDNQKDNKRFKYLLANIDGKIDLEDKKINIVSCFSTLHHIPNVSFLMKEIYRVLEPGGIVLISEPIVSMGNWDDPKTRKGLTKRERGIPIQIFDKIIKDTGFLVVSRKFCIFSPFHLFFSRILKVKFYKSKILVILDYIFSRIFSFNIKYYRRNFIDKISPSNVFYILKKPLE